MNREDLVRLYFEEEGAKGDLSSEQWKDMLARVKAHRQRTGWLPAWWSGISMNLSPVPTTAAALLVAVLAGSILLLTSPWQEAPSGPAGHPSYGAANPGKPGIPGIGSAADREFDSAEFWPTGVPGPQGPTDLSNSWGGLHGRSHFTITWEAEQRLIKPGEPLTLTLTVGNEHDGPILIKAISDRMILRRFDSPRQSGPGDIKTTQAGEMTLTAPDSARNEIAVAAVELSGDFVGSVVDPQKSATVTITVPPDVTRKLPAGQYMPTVEDLSVWKVDNPDERVRYSEYLNNGGVPVVVLPPEGALETAIEVGESREVSGTEITLERINFTPEKTTIQAAAALPESFTAQSGSTPLEEEPRPVPTQHPSQSEPAHPAPQATATPVPAQPPVNPDALPGMGSTALYRVDVGPWRELKRAKVVREADHARLTWTLGPVSVEAREFEFVIPVSGGSDGSTSGGWTWLVPLQPGELTP